MKFTNHDSSHPLSDEILFANILRATGKGEAAEKLLRDKEEISVLAEDIGSRYQRYVRLNNQGPRLKTQATVLRQP